MVLYQSGGGNVTFNECVIENNGYKDDSEEHPYVANSLIYINNPDSTLTMNKCTIKNNSGGHGIYSSGDIVINDSTFTGNDMWGGMFYFNGYNKRTFKVTNSSLTNNPCAVNYIDLGWVGGAQLIFTNCTFNNNGSNQGYSLLGHEEVKIKLVDCDLGTSTLKETQHIEIVDTSAPNGAGSIFGEGSITMIVALLALFASAASICLTVIYNKKKTAPAAANDAPEAESEE